MHERLTTLAKFSTRDSDRVFVIAIDLAIVEDDNFPTFARYRVLQFYLRRLVHARSLIKRYAEQFRPFRRQDRHHGS